MYEIASTPKKSHRNSLKKRAIRLGDKIVVHWPKVCGHVGPGDRFLSDDRPLELIATKVDRTYEDPRPLVKVLTEVSDIHAPEQVIKLGQGSTSPLHQSQLTTLAAKDLVGLDTSLPWADLIGVSFARRSEDVQDLRERLREKGRLNAGIIIKIETQEAFADLTRILLEIPTLPNAAIMIARGDLALQLGFSRLLDMQRELLWFAAVARLPVTWATPVLEHLATTGLPTRAEVSDVTQATEADCIMFNCGP